MQADKFLRVDTLLILGLGLVAFIFDTAGGVIFAKILNLFLKKKINPMIGAAGISAFPMSGRVVHKLALKEDPTNFLLMQATGVNVSGQIASVIAGGLILNFFLLQVVGRMLVKSILIVFRFFCMPQLNNWFYSIPNATHWLSTFLLLIAVTVSIVRITRKNKRKITMQKDDDGMEENDE